MNANIRAGFYWEFDDGVDLIGGFYLGEYYCWRLFGCGGRVSVVIPAKREPGPASHRFIERARVLRSRIAAARLPG